MAERGLSLDHTTIYRWVQRYAPELDKRSRPYLKQANDSWRADETYVKVRGQWMYLYRAVDSSGQTMDFLLNQTRSTRAAKLFFRKVLGRQDVVFNLRVSNIGQNADSIDLAASGQIWTTILSISQVDLDASASADFTVTVSIPPGAADQESDTVTITATSQSDNSKTDAVVLTTTTVASMVCGTTTDTPYKLGDLSVTITDQGTDLDCVRVSKTRSNHPGAVTSMQIGQYWSIEGLTNDQTTTATPDFVFNLTLPHNVTPDTVANVCKYLGGAGASAWDCDRTGSDASTVWRNGITGGFSDWAASNGVPTALTLNSFSVSNHPSDSIFATILVAASALLTLAWRFKRSKRRIDTVSDD